MLAPRSLDVGAPLLLALACASVACSQPEPPAQPGLHLHRLNATQYANSLEAVLGVRSGVAEHLPADAPSQGFDTASAALTTSPLLLEFYAQATTEALDLSLVEGSLASALDGCDPGESEAACARAVIRGRTTVAWRRPPSDAELERLLAVYAEARALGEPLGSAIAAALRAALLSPHFVFRVEATAPAGAPADFVEGYELASRVAYFLWSAPPDAELLALAEQGALSEPSTYEAQVRRMLADPRASALASDFAGQWLAFRYLDDVFKDVGRYPDFDQQLRASMAEEPRLLFDALLAEDGDLRELLLSEDSYVDAHLAALYGLEHPSQGGDVEPETFVPVANGPDRRGVLTQAGLLSVLAYPFTTSPARRGSWVLSNLLCTELGAPPPGVDVPVDVSASTKREAFAAHRANPACAGCHEPIDAIGLAFESYDAIGAFHLSDGGQRIDSSGALPSGVSFGDPVEMASAIAEDPSFVPCVVQQTLTYATGRALDADDRAEIDALASTLESRGHGLRELFVLVATSEAFRARIPEEASP